MRNVFFSRPDIRVSLVYGVVAVLWIVTSDRLAANFFANNPALLESVNVFKGLGFVVVTTAALFIVASAELRKRTQVEKALQQERDISPVGIAILDPAGTIRYANAQANQILGLKDGNITQRTYDAPLWHITDYDGKPLPSEQLFFAQVVQARQAVYGVQHAIEWTNGKRVLLEINAAPIFAVDGTIFEIVTTFNDVTSDYQNAKLLRESEIHYRLLFENNPRPMWIFDLETLVFMEVNNAAVTQYGYSRDEFLRLRLTDIRPPEELARLLDYMQQPRREHQRSGEWRHRLKNGQIIDVEITSHTLNYAGRDAAFVIAQDITSRKRAAAALHESEERYRLLINSLTEYAVFTMDLEGLIASWNGGAENIFGYRANEIIGRHFSALYTPEDLAADRPSQILELVVERGDFREEQWRVRKDGSRFWAEVYLVCMKDETGQLRGFSRVTRDLTERKHAEEQIRYQATLIESVSDAIISTDPAFTIRSWNKAAESLYGWASHEVIGKAINNVVPTTYTQEDQENVLAQFRREGIWKGEVTQSHRDGTPIQILSSVSLTYDSRGAQIGAVAINRDISDRKRAEKTLRESEAKLRLFIEYAPASLAMFDTNMRYQSVSRRWLTDYAIGERDIINKSHYEIFPEISDRWKAVHQRGLAGEVITVDEEDFVRKDGTVHWLRWEVRPWYMDNGSIGGIVIFTEDISERKRAQAALGTSEKRFRTLIEKSTDVIVLYSADRRIVYTSPSSRAILGYSFEEMSQQQRLKFIHPDDEPLAMEMLDRVLGHPDETITYEVRLRQQDGRWRYFAITARNLLHEPAVAAIVLNAHDITEQNRATEAIAKLNQRLTLLRQIDKDIIAASSSEAIVSAVLHAIVSLLPCHSASVALFSEDVSEATILASVSEDTSIVQHNMRFPITPNPLFERLKSGKTLMIPDLTEIGHGISALGGQLMQEGIRSMLNGPMMIEGQLIGTVGVSSTTPHFFGPEHEEFILEIANQLAVALQSARLKEEIQENNQQLKTLSARFVEAQEIERGHIARELHDEVGQTLTALSLLLSVPKRQHETIERPPDLHQAKLLISDLTKRIRDISLDLRPSMLDDLGLIPTLIWYLERYQQQTGITVDLKYSDVERRFAPVIETTLYRIVQESLTNVARHAQVDRASLRLWTTADFIYAQVEDAGKGFDPLAVRQTNRTGGLLGLRERAHLAGGICEIVSNIGEGTLISVTIPLELAIRRN